MVAQEETVNLSGVVEQLKRTAADLGLVVCSQAPIIPDEMPMILWDRNPDEYVQLAHDAGAKLLYYEVRVYDPDHAVKREILGDDEEEEEEEAEGNQWLMQRARDAIKPWEYRRGEISSVRSAWFVDGVAHTYFVWAPWQAAPSDVLTGTVKEGRQIARDQRVELSRERTQLLHRLAEEMARHERFPDAKSEEKREFMAKRLFPELESYEAERVADRASLIYWWDVEPTERTTMAERARQLYRSGESIKNIMAVLKLSEARVRAAIASES
jgi:hypothetical protein